MRTAGSFAALAGLFVVIGWPGHWLLALSMYVTGWLAGRLPRRARAPRRPGYLPDPAAAKTDLTRRIAAYTADDVHDGIGA